MKGVIFESVGAPPKVVDDLPVPEPSPDQILVKSLYTAINPVYVKGLLTSLTLWDLGRGVYCIQRILWRILSPVLDSVLCSGVEVVQYSSHPYPDLRQEQGGDCTLLSLSRLKTAVLVKGAPLQRNHSAISRLLPIIPLT